MELHELDYGGLGWFEKKGHARFTLGTPNLPAPWEFIYENRRILLRVDQFGPVYAQVEPPGGLILFRREAFQRASSWLAWISAPGLGIEPFSNFFRPNFEADPSVLPEGYRVRYEPSKATWGFVRGGLLCETELIVDDAVAALGLAVRVTNQGRLPVDLVVTAALRLHFNPPVLAPWDRPEWYLRTGFCSDPGPGFWTQLLNMQSEPHRRRVAALWSEADGLRAAEISHERWVGQGSFERPQSVFDGELSLRPSSARPWGEYDKGNQLYGVPPVNALQYGKRLGPGESWELRQSLAVFEPDASGAFPALDAAVGSRRLLDAGGRRAAVVATGRRHEAMASARGIRTPDPAFDRYVNEWLPLQMGWVGSLDRGWPSGLRGSRDAANDFLGIAPLDPAWARRTLLEVLSCQRGDGWFPRQFSSEGRQGKHDLRPYADAGCFVTELVYEYLAWTKDAALLSEKLPWLDSDVESTVLEHALRAVGWFLRAENLGEHGLCKIHGGDWCDALNRVGLRGRGESVMVSGQVVLALAQAGEIAGFAGTAGLLPAARAGELAASFEAARKALGENLNRHAWNVGGWFNGVFTDEGEWVFSDRDPDGEARVLGPANWYALIAGVASGERAGSVLAQMGRLRCADGYRLFWPPLGGKPIRSLGRMGSGDMPAGLWENGTVYNHGSHGFLARALAAAGRGDDLVEVLRWMLPCDPSRHPVNAALTPPYGLVNCWLEVPGYERRGGLLFLTGSIAMALRGVYHWMAGLRPTLDGLAFDPCLPAGFDRVEVRFRMGDRRLGLEIHHDPSARGWLLGLNGRLLSSSWRDPLSGRELPFVPDAALGDGGRITLRGGRAPVA